MEAYITEDNKKITATCITSMKSEGKKIAMLTAYDYSTARILDASGVDSILIGDSASNVIAGNSTTLPITLEEMIFLTRSVVKGVKRAFVVCDMPFGSYQACPEDGVRSAVRILKETGCDAVKIEGGAPYKATIKRIIETGIPVVGHLGLTPQSVNAFGGYGVRAKDEKEENQLIEDAKMLEEIGCCAIVVEKVPATVGKRAAEAVKIPIIGIGAGPYVDGQVLVVNDMLGMSKDFYPKFLRQYADLQSIITDAVGNYVRDVKNNTFPSLEESY